MYFICSYWEVLHHPCTSNTCLYYYIFNLLTFSSLFFYDLPFWTYLFVRRITSDTSIISIIVSAGLSVSRVTRWLLSFSSFFLLLLFWIEAFNSLDYPGNLTVLLYLFIYFFFFQKIRFDISCKLQQFAQTVQTLIRCHRMWHLIRVYTVCINYRNFVIKL